MYVSYIKKAGQKAGLLHVIGVLGGNDLYKDNGGEGVFRTVLQPVDYKI